MSELKEYTRWLMGKRLFPEGQIIDEVIKEFHRDMCLKDKDNRTTFQVEIEDGFGTVTRYITEKQHNEMLIKIAEHKLPMKLRVIKRID